MPILTVRAAIVATLQAALPGVDIAEHPRSEFTPADINKALPRDTGVALRVSFSGILEDAALSDNEEDAPSAWAIYIVSKDIKDKPRDTLALKLIGALMKLVSIGDWGELGEDIAARRGEKVRCIPLYQGESDTSSAMLWAVTWKQLLILPACIDPDELRALVTLVTEYDLAPKDGVIDATDNISMETDP